MGNTGFAVANVCGKITWMSLPSTWVLTAGALERVGDEQDARVVHKHLIGVELSPVLDLLLERQRFRIARVEPVIAVHDVSRGFRELLDELVGGRGPAEDRIDAFRPHTLLLHGAGEQHVFVVIVCRNHEIRILRLDLQYYVVEVARRRRMRNGLEHLEAALGQLRVEQLGEPRSEQRVLVHDHHGLGRLAGLVVDGDEIVERGLRNHSKAGPEPERVLEPAGDDVVGDADVDHVRQVVAGGGLTGSEADRARIAADDGRDVRRVHLLDLGIAAFRRRLRVAEDRFDLGAGQRLDAARRVDLLDCDCRTESTLLAGIGQRAGDRMQHAKLHWSALRAQQRRRVDEPRHRGGSAYRRRLQHMAPRDLC